MLRLEDRAQNEVVVVRPVGWLDVRSYQQLRDHLLKLGTDHPRAVIVDLTDVNVASDTSLAIFPAVQTRLQVWPGVPLLLVTGGGAARALLTRTSTGRFLPVHDTVCDAIAAIDEPPPRRVTHLQVPNELTSPRLAREFVRTACRDWDLHALIDDALLLVGELVTNVVVHTSASPLVRVEHRRNLLSVAVYDDQPGEVSLRDPGVGFAGLHGLLLVAQISTAWGCFPTSRDGKVVWATIRAR